LPVGGDLPFLVNYNVEGLDELRETLGARREH
jgi:hypothetical protein